MLHYFYLTAVGKFEGLGSTEITNSFSEMLGQPGIMTFWMVFVVALGIVVCVKGLQNGLERITKVMMIALLLIMVVLAVNSFTMPGAKEGLSFYLLPDFARMPGDRRHQHFGRRHEPGLLYPESRHRCMAIFGSYIGKQHSLAGRICCESYSWIPLWPSQQV